MQGWTSGCVDGMIARHRPPPSPLGRRRSSSRTVGRYGAASRLNCLRFVDMRDEALPRSALADGPPCAEDAAVCVTGAICKQVRVDRGGGGGEGAAVLLRIRGLKRIFLGRLATFWASCGPRGFSRISRTSAGLRGFHWPSRTSLRSLSAGQFNAREAD